MDPELSSEQYGQWWKDLGFSELRQLLFWTWDPIGVRDDLPWTADEYDDYVRMLCPRLREGMTETDVAEALRTFERVEMGEQYNTDAALQELGLRIIEWFGDSQSFWAGRNGLEGWD